ncbi:hypothetical protein [Bradyrhizobium ottawaense]|uniref:hypothetical protein n=1 Tax=Bradyrhizobium ottawaense TaxID=931866 RepID=UPI0030C72AE0
MNAETRFAVGLSRRIRPLIFKMQVAFADMPSLDAAIVNFFDLAIFGLKRIAPQFPG